MFFDRFKRAIPGVDEALPGRPASDFVVPERHAVLGTSIRPPFPAGYEHAVFALGCFWGAERLFWQIPGVHTTAAVYVGGPTTFPTYKEVCSGRTGHAEGVLVVWDPAVVTFEQLVARFFEEHDPTQGMRQGNDIGTQYRSGLFVTTDEQERSATDARARYGELLAKRGYPAITTEITRLGPIYYAEEYHQQYLHKVPHGYCGLKGTGVSCPIPHPALAE